MTEDEKAAARAQAQADATAAATEQTTRDEAGWALQVRNATAAAEHTEAQGRLFTADASLSAAKAETYKALTTLVQAVAMVAFLGGLAAIVLLIRWAW